MHINNKMGCERGEVDLLSDDFFNISSVLEEDTATDDAIVSLCEDVST